MSGQFVFLSKNSYTKDGTLRSFVNFVDSKGNVSTFNGAAYQGNYPAAFDVCDVEFDVQQFGKSTAFILTKIDVIDRLVPASQKEGGK